jgi:hypothetical protein
MGSVFGSEARSDSDAWLADGVAPRVVVCAPGGARGLLELPESRLNPDHGTISGGERSLYEIATAAATLGLEVELRGEICPQILDRITQSAGAGPRVHLEPRAPMPGEIVIVPEAYDIELFAAISLSHARGVVMLLAPPGLWGWSFRSGWRPPDPNSVPVDAVGTADTFRAIDALGLSMWGPLDRRGASSRACRGAGGLDRFGHSRAVARSAGKVLRRRRDRGEPLVRAGGCHH